MPDDGGKPGGSDKPGTYRTFETPKNAADVNALLEAQLAEGYELHSLAKNGFTVVYKELGPAHDEGHLI